MGMAASQARHLALVARKSNCEYEGQQINQARTALSNQSANLFNQMLGIEIPVPPSTQDFTKIQYSFTDGINESAIESWQQLATPEEDYNYVVTHYYYKDVYTGSQKKMNDPQVQFASGNSATVAEIEYAMRQLAQAKEELNEAKAATQEAESAAATLANYSDTALYSSIKNARYEYSVQNNTNQYVFENTNADGSSNSYTYVNYSNLTEGDKTTVDSVIQKLIEMGALDKNAQNPDMSDVFYNATDGTVAFQNDLKGLYGIGTKTSLPVYHTGNGVGSVNSIATTYQADIDEALENQYEKQLAYNEKELSYQGLKRPTYIGNCELTLLTDLTKDQAAELKQVVTDMEKEGIESSIQTCFDDAGNYLGGVYRFKQNGIFYYTTYNDLLKSYQSGTGVNQIDGQKKMAYYNASYVSTKIEETEKALLETDSQGRFTSVRFEDDTVTYALKMETVTDEAAYADAMNQYEYENAKYDKMIQDINAKTSIIQQQDQQLELRLKQLDTEQSALSNEIEAVSKVVKDNVESSFKTFGG